MKNFIKFFKNKKHLDNCKKILCGLEKENLRIDCKKNLSSKPHFFGSKITHPFFTTDFAEMQTELATKLCTNNAALFRSLKEHYHFLTQKMKSENEIFWPVSMPPKLDKDCSFLIAKYPTCSIGEKRQNYRKELCKRYGSHMQMICGIHYNFSFSDDFFSSYAAFKKRKLTRAFIDESYLHLIRNFLKHQWAICYLFGASNVFHKTYKDIKEKGIEYFTDDSYIIKNATSIRLSPHGYQSKIQNSRFINYNSLSEYVDSMNRLINEVEPNYLKLSNPFVLQAENEHYSMIRPKRNISQYEKLIKEIESRGIQYLEVRGLDLQPDATYGVHQEDLDFMHLFLVGMLIMKSEKMNEVTQLDYLENLNITSLRGKEEGLKLKNGNDFILLKEWLKEILEFLSPLSSLLGTNYEKALKAQKAKVINPNLLPSEKLKNIISKNYVESIYSWGKNLQNQILNDKYPQKKLDDLAKVSLEKEKELLIFDQLELSTQFLLNKANEIGVKYRILDAKENIVELKKKGKTELVKQATKTSKDTYITPLVMTNKHVSKVLLDEASLKVPKGKVFNSEDEAFKSFEDFKNEWIVVKPNNTNFGIGIEIFLANSQKKFNEACKKAFSFDETILIEEYISGNEYRFLFIKDKVVAVLERDPANVIGNGLLTIEQLFFLKKKRKLDSCEIQNLKNQNLSQETILKNNDKVYLRKNSNISTGGDAIDRTDEIDQSYFSLACKAAKAVKAKICGIDMIIKNPKRKSTKNNYAIIEVNFNPVLYFHESPDYGKKRAVSMHVLELLGFVDE